MMIPGIIKREPGVMNELNEPEVWSARAELSRLLSGMSSWAQHRAICLYPNIDYESFLLLLPNTPSSGTPFQPEVVSWHWCAFSCLSLLYSSFIWFGMSRHWETLPAYGLVWLVLGESSLCWASLLQIIINMNILKIMLFRWIVDFK